MPVLWSSKGLGSRLVRSPNGDNPENTGSLSGEATMGSSSVGNSISANCGAGDPEVLRQGGPPAQGRVQEHLYC